MSAERLERLRTVVREDVEAGSYSGAVVLIRRNGELAMLEAFGAANVDTGRAMQSDDVFRIASMTKAITAVAVLMLYEEGRISLNAPVGRYLPSFDRTFAVAVPDPAGDGFTFEPATRPMTIRQLLTHSSGLSYRFMRVEPLTTSYTEAGITDGFSGETMPLADFVAELAKQPLAHEPGAAWSYGLNSDVLGRVVEVVSGQPFDEFLKDRLFDPLEMNDTAFEVSTSTRKRMPAVHRAGSDGVLEVIPPGRVEDGPTVFSVDYPYDGITSFPSGGAGLSSTAADYAKFLEMVLNGGELDGKRILSRKTIALLTTDQLGHLENPGFGPGGFSLGFAISAGPASGSIMSEGTLSWSGFFNTLMWVDPAEQLVVVLMTQHYPYGIELLNELPQLVYQAIED